MKIDGLYPYTFSTTQKESKLCVHRSPKLGAGGGLFTQVPSYLLEYILDFCYRLRIPRIHILMKLPQLSASQAFVLGILSVTLLGGGFLYLNNSKITSGRDTAIEGSNNQETDISSVNTAIKQNASENGGISSNDGNIVNGKDNTTVNKSIGNVNGNVTIYTSNDELPGYDPSQGFKAPPSDLSKYPKRDTFLPESIISGKQYVRFADTPILINKKKYSTVFFATGATRERSIGFNLDGQQKAAFFQFGLRDLEEGRSNLTYLVRISVDGKEVWVKECQFSTKQQILSVPLDIPGATSIVIEYSISELGGMTEYAAPPLSFTNAELRY